MPDEPIHNAAPVEYRSRTLSRATESAGGRSPVEFLFIYVFDGRSFYPDALYTAVYVFQRRKEEKRNETSDRTTTSSSCQYVIAMRKVLTQRPSVFRGSGRRGHVTLDFTGRLRLSMRCREMRVGETSDENKRIIVGPP